MTDATEAPPADATPEPKKKKIAIIGSAVSSVTLAPFFDRDWEMWGCSPANQELPRIDVWFELHNVDQKKKEGLTAWLEWLKKQPHVYMQKASPDFPGAVEYPLAEMVKKFGRYWWTSQISYMLALAIEQDPSHIGIYGVDMAANSEYNQQRLACQHFMLEASKRGIQISVPPESDLLEPAPMYGYCESSRRWRKYNARILELKGRISRLDNEVSQKSAEKAHLIGALDDMEYQIAHWANTPDFFE
jgi:hypothetical protein